ncbi:MULTISPECIES: Csu type fimbrial protein [Serratia]|uniref:Csu type fimbrial protein n=1 Tax=Serratia TaxID=613 RepID=UPI000B09A6E3|nr:MULTISPECIES: spore coat protein U domain-containing protein [Serratia]MBJ2093549.1 spore coat U domain-containing protein [Serratia ureilytica]MBN5267707.1 spore coat U domain-containing protein [Serratia ureilytica]MBN5357280.1 spore coat U domain-containing protein [Serratia ureilytica]
MMSRQVKIFLAALLLMCGQRALADCATTNGTVTLPSSNSFAVYNGQISAQGTAGLNCTGLGLNLLTQNTVTVKIASTTNNMALLNGNGSGDKISYLIYPDSNYQYPYSVGQTIDYSSLNLLSLILISSNVNFPVYIKTVVGANVSAGTYTDTINLVWNYHICGLGLIGLCIWWDGTNQPSTVTVTAVITKSCLINTANNVNFGSMALVGQFNPINQNITLTCTKSQSYSSYFTNGNNPITGWRRMISGTSNFLQYQIYLPNTSTVWSSTNAQSGTGTGLAQSIPFTAAVNPAQTEVPVGTYQDNVSYVVTY